MTTILVITPPAPVTLIESVQQGPPGPAGPPGLPGPAGGPPFEYVMPAAQTTATIDHDLGYDPVAIQVFDADGVQYSDFTVVFTVPDSQVRIGFDVSLAAIIRLK